MCWDALKAYMTLSTLRDGPLAQQDLCISMHLDPNNCVLMLNELEAAGHVKRRRDPADRRRHIVEIARAGRKALGQAERAMESLEDDVLGALSAEERDVLRGLLGRALGAPRSARGRDLAPIGLAGDQAYSSR